MAGYTLRKKKRYFSGSMEISKIERGIKLKMTDQKKIKDFEERIEKVVYKSDNLELNLLLEILKSLNKLILKVER